jgi:uncharacterized peroxidase-related enzyme
MRLKVLDSGFRPLQRAQLRLVKRMAGYVPGPIAVMSYRRDFFGKYFASILQMAMRRTRAWRKGDVEMFAAFVSQQNQCAYCRGDHSAVAVLALNDRDLIQAALGNWRSAPVTEPQRAMLGFLEKLTLHPSTLRENDIQQLRDAGLSDQAVEEAIRVCFALTVINRLADALDFEVPSDASTERAARILFMAGYGHSSLRG